MPFPLHKQPLTPTDVSSMKSSIAPSSLLVPDQGFAKARQKGKKRDDLVRYCATIAANPYHPGTLTIKVTGSHGKTVISRAKAWLMRLNLILCSALCGIRQSQLLWDRGHGASTWAPVRKE
jgi:hypothetical protein